MSIFKTNSRFSALVEDSDINNSRMSNKKEPEKNRDDTHFNSFKREDRPRYDDRPMYDNKQNGRFSDPKKDIERRLEEEQKRKEEEIKRKNKEREEALSDNNFPDLFVSNKVEILKEKTIQTTFLDKIKEKKMEENIIVKPDEECIQSGYIVNTKNKNTHKLIYKYGEETNSNDMVENISPNDVFKTLVELYETRKKKYIELWGEDEYDKEFRFQNYEYGYFDRLDQEYEEELERQMDLKILNYNSSDEYLNNDY